MNKQKWMNDENRYNFNPKEMKFALSNFLSNEALNILYESLDIQLTFDTLVNVFMFQV